VQVDNGQPTVQISRRSRDGKWPGTRCHVEAPLDERGCGTACGSADQERAEADTDRGNGECSAPHGRGIKVAPSSNP